MSKIANFFELRKKEIVKAQHQQEKETLAAYAKKLNINADVLIDKLRQAGVYKNSVTDLITKQDKAVYRSFRPKELDLEEVPRKRITLRKIECDPTLKAVAEQANGAEWECLEQFANEVIFHGKINPKLQTTVNLIVAKAVICGALPKKKLGRKKSSETEYLGIKIAQEYWSLRDSGTSYSEAVLQMAEKVHKDERHVMRIVEKHKKSVGLTLEDREQKRQWEEVLRYMYGITQNPNGQMIPSWPSKDIPTPEFKKEDFIEYLDEQILKTVELIHPTDIK